MEDKIRVLLEMSQYLKAHGESKLAAECRMTATRICDYIMWRRDCRNNIVNRPARGVQSQIPRNGEPNRMHTT